MLLRNKTMLQRSGLSRFLARFDLRKVHRDEGGNVMVIYIAASLLIVGMVWAIIGTGARVVQKETLQSSADAAAFSAAVIKAKGMNIIAFCNLLLALLLAIIIILRLLKDALILAGILLTAASLFQPELAPLAGEVDNMANQFANVENNIENGMLKAMKGISTFERGVSKVTPALALVEAWRIGTDDAYKFSMGSKQLYTIALPLPLGQDLSLPTQDGTWKQLCDQAKQTITRILDWVLQKVVGSALAKWVSKAFNMIAGPFESAVCGGGGAGGSTQLVDQKESDCDKCRGGNPSAVEWSGTTVQGGAPQTFTTSDFAGMDCGGAGSYAYQGVQFDNVSFVACTMKEPYAVANDNTSMDKPLPLVLTQDWKTHTQVRAFTVLAGTRMHERRQSVGIARRGGAGSDPLPIDAVMTMAQAEFFSWNGHDDLWHMDWRARLVPFTFGNDTGAGGNTGDTTGTVSAGALSQVSGAITGFLDSETGQTLTRQFLIH